MGRSHDGRRWNAWHATSAREHQCWLPVAKLRPGRVVENPAQALVVGFLLRIGVGTVLLSLPIAAEGQHRGVLDALFLSTSAVTITGLTSSTSPSCHCSARSLF